MDSEESMDVQGKTPKELKKYFSVSALIGGFIISIIGVLMMRVSASTDPNTQAMFVVFGMFAFLGGLIPFVYGLLYSPIQWIRKLLD